MDPVAHIWLVRAICIATTAILTMQFVTLLVVAKSGHQDPSVARLKWLAGFAVCYSFATTISAFPVWQIGLLEHTWLVYGIAGMLAFIFYARFMSMRLSVPLPSPALLYGTGSAAILSFVLMFLDIHWWNGELFFRSHEDSRGVSLFLDQNQVDSPSLLVILIIATTVPVNVWCSIRFLRAAAVLRNRVLMAGIIINFLVILNDALFGMLLSRYLIPLSFLGYSVEITFFTFEQIRRYERQKRDLEIDLLEASKEAEVGAMVGQICHDVRNPTAILDGWIKALRAMESSPESQRILDRMEHSVLRIEDTVSDYLSYLRSERDTQKGDVALKKVVDKACQFTSHKAVQAGVERVYLSIDEGLLVRCRENSLLTIMINLLSNSFEAVATQESAKKYARWVYVEARPSSDKGFIELLVKDSGPGVANEQVDRLFRKKITTKERGKGTGIGLRFVAKILEAEGGSVYYDSEAIQTTFVVRLPRPALVSLKLETKDIGTAASA